MTDDHRQSRGVLSDEKRRALDRYDAWVERELGGREGRRVRLLAVLGVAATILIAAVLVRRMAQDEEPGSGRDPAESGASPTDPDAKEQIQAWVRQLPLPQHVEVARAVRAALDRRLLTPAKKWMSRKPAGADAGVNRILNRGRFETVTLVRGGGAYFSFSTRSNDYDHAPDLELQGWVFSSGFGGGDTGRVEIIDAGSLDAVTIHAVPPHLVTLPAMSFYHAERRMQPSRPPAMVGKVYVIRSVQWRTSDLIAAFQILEQDDNGVTFAWKVLKMLPVPHRR